MEMQAANFVLMWRLRFGQSAIRSGATGSFYLKNSSIDFTLHVVSQDFDNNIYGEYKLHLFIPWRGIPKKLSYLWKKLWKRQRGGEPLAWKQWDLLPWFLEKHFLKNDYNTGKSSWMRLAIHPCDPAKQSKCANTSEINNFFKKNILSM